MSQANQVAPCLIIVGMHRSGTSLTASLLQNAGVHVGERLMGIYSGNPRGHFENLDFFEFHQLVLKSQAIHPGGWTLQKHIHVEDYFVKDAETLISSSSSAPIWGWKDPRTTLFLEFWAQLLPNANFIMVYRAPWEVVDSIYRRGSDEIFMQQPNLAPKIWQHYNQNILDFYNKNSGRCLLVNIKTITTHISGWIDRLNHKFQLSLKYPDPSIYEPALLRQQRQSSKYPNLLQTYFPSVLELYNRLENRAWKPEGEAIDLSWKNPLSPLSLQECAFQDWLDLRSLEKELWELKAQLTQLQAEREQLMQGNQHQVQNLQQQSSSPIAAVSTEA